MKRFREETESRSDRSTFGKLCWNFGGNRSDARPDANMWTEVQSGCHVWDQEWTWIDGQVDDLHHQA